MNHEIAVVSLERVDGWRKSSFSEGANNCVEVSDAVPGVVGIRDSKLGDAGPILAVPAASWQALVRAHLQ